LLRETLPFARLSMVRIAGRDAWPESSDGCQKPGAGTGQREPGLIDREAFLEGTDERFRVSGDRKRFPQYAKEIV
jgi:hypothetical protein